MIEKEPDNEQLKQKIITMILETFNPNRPSQIDTYHPNEDLLYYIKARGPNPSHSKSTITSQETDIVQTPYSVLSSFWRLIELMFDSESEIKATSSPSNKKTISIHRRIDSFDRSAQFFPGQIEEFLEIEITITDRTLASTFQYNILFDKLTGITLSCPKTFFPEANSDLNRPDLLNSDRSITLYQDILTIKPEFGSMILTITDHEESERFLAYVQNFQ